jgi:urease accessory protein
MSQIRHEAADLQDGDVEMQKRERNRVHPARLMALAAVTLMSMTSLAGAHEATRVAGGFLSGFTHPLFGWDHVAAMVAVGLWGAFLGPRAIWLLPIVFPLVMAFGAVLGILGVPLPAVEMGIAASAVVLGVMVAIAAQPPLWAAGIIVAVFAIFHGHAHGTELPVAASAIAYAVGFVVGTGLLHLIGITLGLSTRWRWGAPAVRAAGGVIALAGVAFLTGLA